MIDWNRFCTKPTEETIAEYPTIIDVIEDIIGEEKEKNKGVSPLSCDENVLHEMSFPGRYLVARDKNTNGCAVLIPTSPNPFVLYRGEREIYDECKPTFLRIDDNDAKLLAKLRMEEFRLTLNTHPVIHFLLNNKFQYPGIRDGFRLKVPVEAIAQHYGLDTSFIDVTNNKWVAAFFAIANWKGVNCFPVVPKDTDKIEKRCGSIFRIKEVDSFGDNAPIPIGLQYFNRPGKQSGFMIDLKDIQDFRYYPNVERLYFRHDKKANQLVFDLSQQGRMFFPDDSLVDIAKTVKNTCSISVEAANACHDKFCNEMPETEWNEVLIRLGVTLKEKSEIGFDQQKIALEFEAWEKKGLVKFLEKLIVLPGYRI